MSITVETKELVEIYEEAERWVIDESGRLHVIGASGVGNIASFNANVWMSVQRRGSNEGGIH